MQAVYLHESGAHINLKIVPWKVAKNHVFEWYAARIKESEKRETTLAEVESILQANGGNLLSQEFDAVRILLPVKMKKKILAGEILMRGLGKRTYIERFVPPHKRKQQQNAFIAPVQQRPSSAMQQSSPRQSV